MRTRQKNPRRVQRPPVGAGVVLRVRPQRGLGVAHEGALQLPALEQLPRGRVGVGLAPRQVDGDDVEGRARDQRGALIVVDHVIRAARRRRPAAPPRPGRSGARAAVGRRPWRWRTLAAAGPSASCPAMHERGHDRAIAAAASTLSFNGAWRSLVAHLLWEQGVAGSNPAAPMNRLFSAQPSRKLRLGSKSRPTQTNGTSPHRRTRAAPRPRAAPRRRRAAGAPGASRAPR